jgi:ribosomal protein L11 methyltransferase
MTLRRLAIRVRSQDAELALAALLPILQNGAEEIESAGAVEYALYAPAGELPSEDDIRELAGDALLSVEVTDVAEGWEDEYKRFLAPVDVLSADGEWQLRVRPPWHEALPPDDATDVVIDPGRSFGAGTHATTQMMLQLLLESEASGPLCDWGAGSGVLAIAAARLGYEPVVAVDVEPDALETILRNAAMNGVRLTTKWLNLAATPAPWAPTVTANLTGDLLAWAAECTERPPERMFASGVLEREVGDLVAAWAPHGLVEVDRRVRGEWAAVVLELE